MFTRINMDEVAFLVDRMIEKWQKGDLTEDPYHEDLDFLGGWQGEEFELAMRFANEPEVKAKAMEIGFRMGVGMAGDMNTGLMGAREMLCWIADEIIIKIKDPSGKS